MDVRVCVGVDGSVCVEVWRCGGVGANASGYPVSWKPWKQRSNHGSPWFVSSPHGSHHNKYTKLDVDSDLCTWLVSPTRWDRGVCTCSVKVVVVVTAV